MDFNSSSNVSFSENCSYFSRPDLSNSPWMKANKMVRIILFPIVLLIGIPGNILTMMVIFRLRKTMTSTDVFLRMLAITDLTLLIMGALVDWLKTAFGFRFRATSSFVCKLSNCLYYWSAQCSSWIIVAITVDRIISIVIPYRYTRICTKMFSQVTCLVIGLFLFALNSHFFYGFGISDTYSYLFDSTCGPLELGSYERFYFDIWPWLDLIFVFAVPFVIISVGNSIILYKLVKIKSKKMKASGSVSKMDGDRSTTSIMVLILCLNFVFFICLVPISLFLINESAIFAWADEVLCIDDTAYEYRYAVIKTVSTTAVCLSFINSAINFVLYVLSGTKFRGEIHSMLTCRPVGRESVFH